MITFGFLNSLAISITEETFIGTVHDIFTILRLKERTRHTVCFYIVKLLVESGFECFNIIVFVAFLSNECQVLLKLGATSIIFVCIRSAFKRNIYTSFNRPYYVFEGYNSS